MTSAAVSPWSAVSCMNASSRLPPRTSTSRMPGKAEHHFDGRGLARAVRAQQRDRLARSYGQVDRPDSAHSPVRLGQLGQDDPAFGTSFSKHGMRVPSPTRRRHPPTGQNCSQTPTISRWNYASPSTPSSAGRMAPGHSAAAVGQDPLVQDPGYWPPSARPVRSAGTGFYERGGTRSTAKPCRRQSQPAGRCLPCRYGCMLKVS
jgi:hypothetical protein